MAIYVVGDVQGCFDALQELLALIKFNKDYDELWLTGDLVNRGQQSLAVLNYIMALPKVITVLGNHDLSLLTLAYGVTQLKQHTMDDILESPNKESILSWLRHRPLLHYDQTMNTALVHAGIPPPWDIVQAKACAKETETILKSDSFTALLENLYGNSPAQWDENLQGWDRHRYIINALTRMRFCTRNGELDFSFKGAIGSQPPHLLPWFKSTTRKTRQINIIFGHWAALHGQTNDASVIALDTGCVWGKQLTALRLNDKKRYTVNCQSC